jgi:2,4-dienoyl-CoA reductase (NADPH2)
MQTSDNLGCAVNPFSGREADLVISRGNKKVVVVGGGTGGLEAARLAAEAGHRVVLFERQNQLGGSLLLASTVHTDNERFLGWLLAEVKRLDIECRAGTPASVELIKAEHPDAVIVATGAVIRTPNIPGIERANVITGALMRQIVAGDLDAGESWRLAGWQRNILQGLMPLVQQVMTPGLLRRASRWWMPVGKVAVVIGSDLVAIELAEFLAQRGRKVHVVDSATKIIPEVGKKRRHEHMDRLDHLRITVNTAVGIRRIESGAVIISVNGAEHTIPCDSVVVCGEPVAETTLANDLKVAGMAVQSIGDCTGLGLIVKATRTAAEAVAEIQ